MWEAVRRRQGGESRLGATVGQGLLWADQMGAGDLWKSSRSPAGLRDGCSSTLRAQGKVCAPPQALRCPPGMAVCGIPGDGPARPAPKAPYPFIPCPAPRREGGFGDMKESSTPKPAPSVKMFPGRCLGLLILWDQPRRRPRCLGRGGQTHPSPGNPLGTAEPFGHVADGLSTLGRQNAEQWRLQGVPWSLSPSLSHKGSRRFPPFPPAPALLPPLLSPSPSSFPAAG